MCVFVESVGRRFRSPKMGLSVPLEWLLGPSTSPSTCPHTQFRPPSSVTCVDSSNPPTGRPASCLPCSANPWPSPAPCLPVHCQVAASLLGTSQLRGSCSPQSLSSLPVQRHPVSQARKHISWLFLQAIVFVVPLPGAGGGGSGHNLRDPKGCCTQSGP